VQWGRTCSRRSLSASASFSNVSSATLIEIDTGFRVHPKTGLSRATCREESTMKLPTHPADSQLSTAVCCRLQAGGASGFSKAASYTCKLSIGLNPIYTYPKRT
jgi:hypothetical protein